MARRTISRSLIRQAEEAARDEPLPENAGVTGAWRAGATAQLKADLEATEADAVARVLSGRAELSLEPRQIDDPLGSDRRADWRERPDFMELKASIEANGQDQPVHVTPADPGWRPDARTPFEVAGVTFLLLAGRRRLAALQDLGRPVRAIIAPVAGRGAARRSEMLERRWRENAERADLSAFERLTALGEMYAAAAETAKEENAKRPTAAAFADAIGVSEAQVSRGRAVLKRHKDIMAAVDDPYALSMSALYALLPRLDKVKTAPKPAPLRAIARAEDCTISARARNGEITLTAKTTRVIDQAALDGLVRALVEKLEEEAETE